MYMKLVPSYLMSRAKWLFSFVLFFLVGATPYLSGVQEQDDSSHTVIVSVAPHQFFVEKVAGNTVKILLFVPANASSHTFEPTPKQMLAASHADLWFGIGETFETRALQALQQSKHPVQFVDLRKGVPLITAEEDGAHHHHCCHANCADLHIWLSPKLAQIQIETIAAALTERYPENAELYQHNLAQFLKELQDLDQEITQTLAPLKNRVIMVSHPAYGYFTRDYHLKQLSIEFEGKDPTPRQLTQVLENARNAKISTIFIQMQYNNKGARLIADELKAKIVVLDPYSGNYIESMREIARQFAAQEAP